MFSLKQKEKLETIKTTFPKFQMRQFKLKLKLLCQNDIKIFKLSSFREADQSNFLQNRISDSQKPILLKENHPSIRFSRLDFCSSLLSAINQTSLSHSSSKQHHVSPIPAFHLWLPALFTALYLKL